MAAAHDDEIDFADLEARFADALAETEPEPETDALVVIDGLPVVDAKKEEKLLAVLTKAVFAPAKAAPVPGSLLMPRGADGMSRGCLFVQLPSADAAGAVVAAASGYRLDKAHVLSAYRLCDFERILASGDAAAGPLDAEAALAAAPAFVPREHLRAWLADAAARDQFLALSAGGALSVCWGPTARAGAVPATEVVAAKPNWADLGAAWSPAGAYLATLHAQGVVLWGGASFARVGRYAHAGVRRVSFSPRETVLVSWAPPDASRPGEPNVLVWDVASGRLLRSFAVAEAGEDGPAWPYVRFSPDDATYGRVVDGAIVLYSVAGDAGARTTLPAEGVRDFAWSPADDMLVHWSAGTADVPARIALLGAPRGGSLGPREVLRTKNVFCATRISAHWHPGGDFLAVHVERHSRNRKHVLANLELFRVRGRGVPVETLEFPETQAVLAFAWEPESPRFALGLGLGGMRAAVGLYTMAGSAGTADGLPAVQRLASAERRAQAVARLAWSPRGDFLLAAGAPDAASLALEFLSCGAGDAPAAEISSLAVREHFLASDFAWDPSGRFVASFVSAARHASDAGYALWDARGEQLLRAPHARLLLFAWRPRPRSLLPRDAQRDVLRRLREYALRFEEEDLAELGRETASSAQAKGRAVALWNEWRRHCRRDAETRAARRRALLGQPGDDAASDAVVERWVQDEILDERVEEVVEDAPSDIDDRD